MKLPIAMLAVLISMSSFACGQFPSYKAEKKHKTRNYSCSREVLVMAQNDAYAQCIADRHYPHECRVVEAHLEYEKVKEEWIGNDLIYKCKARARAEVYNCPMRQ